jgi:hypothetical protein
MYKTLSPPIIPGVPINALHADVYLAKGNVNTESYATLIETLPSAQ